MALHHRLEITDMRYAFDHDSGSTTPSSAPPGSNRSSISRRDYSARSYRTQSSDYSNRGTRPTPHIHYDSDTQRHEDKPQRFFDDRPTEQSPQSSVESIVESDDEQPLREQAPEPDIYDLPSPLRECSAIPANPSDFSRLFPSRRRLIVRHDDSTLDGNMNLRIDTEVSIGGCKRDMTLFHLRMHDLERRDFSLRRYCRDSGREVCNYNLKQSKTTNNKARPSFHQSLSSVLSGITKKSDNRTSASSGLKRFDSGYGSMDSVEFDEDRYSRSAGHEPRPQRAASTAVVRLEFSNYAHVDVRRAGSKGGRRYEFEYWGVAYSWKRRRDQRLNEVSFLLTQAGSDKPLGFIRPTPLSADEGLEEQRLGGWIPPCSMWIEDESIVRSQKDLSDVIVACGLMALADDSIRARFPAETSKSSWSTLSLTQSGIDLVNPRHLLSEIFGSDGSGSRRTSRPSSSGRQSAAEKSSGVGAFPVKPRIRGHLMMGTNDE